MSRGAITHDSGRLWGGYGATVIHSGSVTCKKTCQFCIAQFHQALRCLTRFFSAGKRNKIRHLSLSPEIENRLRIRRADRLIRNDRARRGAVTREYNRLAAAGPMAAQIRKELNI